MYMIEPLMHMEIDGKEFVELSTFATCPEIRKKSYLISRDGDIYSLISNRYLKPTFDKSIGYYLVNLQLNNGRARTFQIHRMLMITFNFIYNYDEMQVNHMDGIKTNNGMDNLEWVTPLGNVLHALEHDLLITGEDCPWSILTEEQVREICETVQNNGLTTTITDLARKYHVSISVIGDILRGSKWKQVSKDYDLNYNMRGRFTNEQVHFMCQVFSQNKDKSFEYLYYLIIFMLQLPEDRFIRRRIYKIYHKDPNNFAYITSQYDY